MGDVLKIRDEYRQNKELPLLEEYFAWLKTVHPEKRSKLKEAIRYSLNQKQQLCAFLDNGEVPISNNLAENAIRPFTLGRKKTGCSAIRPKVPKSVRSYTPWWKAQRQTE